MRDAVGKPPLLTLGQFKAARMRETCLDYGISEAEYKRIYGSSKREWIQYLEQEVAGGRRFTKAVCRSVADHGCDLGYWQKFYRCVPRDVLLTTGRTITL